MKECLLNDSDIHGLLNEIIQTCFFYSNVIIRFYNAAFIDEKLVHLQVIYFIIYFEFESKLYNLNLD